MREYPILHLDTNVNEHERNEHERVSNLDTNVNEHERSIQYYTQTQM